VLAAVAAAMGREREGRREYVWIGELRVVAASETVSSRAERERGEREGRRRKKKRKVQPCPRERESRGGEVAGLGAV
jgi:hypothetical protein